MATQTAMIGRYVGDYQITELLGEGGMGVVFKGVHPTLGQVVAIKMLHPNLVKADSIKQRFLREAQAMARLRHPNILTLYNFIDSADGCFIVMEFVEGKTFEDLLQDHGMLTPEKSIDLFVPVCQAMQYAHNAGIIHRDIKPSNLMILNNGVVKIMDFGTAKMAGGPALTQQGMTLGTVVYMSPEQLMGRDLSPAADIYSLGVTLYELVTGKLPFYHDNEMELMKMIMRQPAPPPSSHYPALPKSLERCITRAIEKDMNKRFKSADEFAKELEKVKGDLEKPAVAVAPPPPPPAPVATPPPPPPAAPTPAPGLEDTQAVKGQALPAPTPAVSPAPSGAPAAEGKSPLVMIGGIVAGLGIVVGAVLIMVAGVGIGAGVMGGLGGLGIVLLIVGLTSGGKSAAPAGPPPAALSSSSPGAKTPPTPIPPPGAPASDKRSCPSCGRVLLPTMSACPFCSPSKAKAEETTQAAQFAPKPESFATPPGFSVQTGVACVEIIDGPNRGQRIELGQGSITVGRAPDNIVVIKDPSVSSHHARIDFYQGKYFLSDLKSSNGTYVNNNRVEQLALNHKDLVVMGSSRMIVNLGAG